MKKKLLFIILSFFILVPNVYGKYCSDYSVSQCDKHKTDDKKNTCAIINGKCDVDVIKTPCSDVKPKKKYVLFGEKTCGLDSSGQLCNYDETTDACINAATNQNHKFCADYSKDDCPEYVDGNACGKTKTGCKLKSETKCEDYDPGETCPTSLNGSVCSSTSKACITTTTKEEMENPSDPPSTTSTVGQIKAITCTGNQEDQIPAGLPRFVRGLFNILRFLVPVVIIVFGMIDFFKAMTSSNESDMDSKKGIFIRRLIAGVALFFVLAIVQWVFGLIGSKDNFMGCVSCFLTTESDCADAGYIDPGANDRQHKEPTKTPPSSNNGVTIASKDDDDDDDSSSSSNSNSNSSSNSNSNNNSSSNKNNSSNGNKAKTDTPTTDDCKKYNGNARSCTNRQYCQWRSDNKKCSQNPDWLCTDYTFSNCPEGKKDSSGKYCVKYRSGGDTKCLSGRHCYQYTNKNDCPVGKTDSYGDKCRLAKTDNGTYVCRKADS